MHQYQNWRFEMLAFVTMAGSIILMCLVSIFYRSKIKKLNQRILGDPVHFIKPERQPPQSYASGDVYRICYNNRMGVEEAESHERGNFCS